MVVWCLNWSGEALKGRNLLTEVEDLRVDRMLHK